VQTAAAAAATRFLKNEELLPFIEIFSMLDNFPLAKPILLRAIILS
jgi:hypothetical protein